MEKNIHRVKQLHLLVTAFFCLAVILVAVVLGGVIGKAFNEVKSSLGTLDFRALAAVMIVQTVVYMAGRLTVVIASIQACREFLVITLSAMMNKENVEDEELQYIEEEINTFYFLCNDIINLMLVLSIFTWLASSFTSMMSSFTTALVIVGGILVNIIVYRHEDKADRLLMFVSVMVAIAFQVGFLAV